MTEFFPAPLGPSHPPPKEWSADSLILLILVANFLMAYILSTRKKLFAHAKIILFILRGQTANNLPHLGQIANNVHTQTNNKINESADHSLGGGWDGPNGAGKNSVIFFL